VSTVSETYSSYRPAVAPQPLRRSTALPLYPTRSELMGRYLTWVGQPFPARWPVRGPLIALLSLTLLFRVTDLDRWCSAWFYDPLTHTWPAFYDMWCTLFYRGGTFPAFGLAIWGAILAVWGLCVAHRRDWLRAGLFLLLVFGLGPGLIINTAFKEHWGRPRPHQLVEFGGTQTFVPVGTPGAWGAQNSSFPSGHAAVAFFLIAPAFITDGRRPHLARRLLWCGFLFGAGMSITRVVQGGHFVSDVVWSAGIVYLTCVVLARVILKPRALPTT
jgi:membrane-associated PAP2 superfamily phosphatase